MGNMSLFAETIKALLVTVSVCRSWGHYTIFFYKKQEFGNYFLKNKKSTLVKVDFLF